MTEEQRELMMTAARSVLAEHDAGRTVDPHRLAWAEWVVQFNGATQPLTETPA